MTTTEESARTDAPGSRLRWWREVLYATAFYLVYSIIRNQFGSATADGTDRALDNALRIIDFEKMLGLFIEDDVQAFFIDWHWFMEFWNVFYGTFHFAVTAGALIWLYRRFAPDYRLWRNALALTTAFALIGFSLFPLMPPRLLPESLGYEFVDSLAEIGGLWSFDSGTMQEVSNQYAAMPSLHIAWALWSLLVLHSRLRQRWARALVIVYPAATLFGVVVTANHYWIDAVGGAAVVGAGLAAARAVETLWHGRQQGGDHPRREVGLV